MSAYSNLQSESSPVDRLVRQVIAICAKHRVNYGSPDDLRGFLHALDTNKHLAMDFWSMVARMSERGAVENPDWLLSIIVEAVTGQTLADLSAQDAIYQQPIQRLRGLLAGEDVRPPAPAPTDRKPDRKPVRAVFPLDPAPTPPAPYLAGGRRLSLEPDPPLAPSPRETLNRRPAEDELNWVIPLRSYAESNPKSPLSGGLVFGLFLVAVLAACTAFAVRYHDRIGSSIQAGTSAAVDAWHGSPSAPAPPAPKPASIASTQAHPTIDPAGSAPITQPSQPPAPTPQTQTSSRLNSNLAQSPPPRESDSVMPAKGGDRVVVPEILMRQNLISSPTPTSDYGHGRVVMEAIVTRHGNVSHIHVVSGDSSLREAAIDAALARRYQPYLLNGTPIDVSTTITLDF
jgi:hypothetical protein